jgi:hypothetical protein
LSLTVLGCSAWRTDVLCSVMTVLIIGGRCP